MSFRAASQKLFLACSRFLIVVVFVCGMTSCGIDDEPYLSPELWVSVTSNTKAEVGGMSASGENMYSPSYLLYYKIYISGESESSTIQPDAMSRINGTLNSDYRGILPYTTLNTSTPQVFTPTVFSNRNFYPIVIGSTETLSASTSTITIDFSNVNNALLPSLMVNGGTAQTLNRSNGGGTFTPLPLDDRRFRNFSDLRNAQNRDVAQLSGDGDYSYCAVYIIKRGINPNTLTAIYSAPTFIAVFRLPDDY
ncbi:MAG: hypothetical protein LBT00_14670 [Spirochaetaceae bacterium]|jgi:hypothetical protein|nr:hypothetical protein [Spirochaetaceae bacterium]